MKIVESLRVRLLRVFGTTAAPDEPEQEWSWGEFRRRVVEALPYVLIIMMAVSWMEALGWFRGFEASHLDAMIRVHRPELSQDIVVVEIGEDDYQKLFEGTSPLDKFELLDLIQAIQKYNPRVIGVDIDTNDWAAPCKRNSDGKRDASCAEKCGRLIDKLNALRKAQTPRPGAEKLHSAIVWAAVPRTLEVPLGLNPDLKSLPLNCDSKTNPQCDPLGVPRFPIDDDGSVRHFERRVEVAKTEDRCPEGALAKGEKCYMPTFAQAILQEYAGVGSSDSDGHVIFNFQGGRYRFQTIDSRQFLTGEKAKGETEAGQGVRNENKEKEIDETRAALFDGKIVLIGGGFPEARDEYFTPMGPMEGVKLNALAIQTDLTGGGITDLNEISEFCIDLCVSIGLVFVFYRFENRPMKALLISSSVIPAAFVFSLIAFNSLNRWFNFIPVAAGVVIHQLSDLAEGRAKAQRELDKLRNERQQVEVDVASIEEFAVVEDAEPAEAGTLDETTPVEDQKAKRAAGGAA
jgi:CHASE2 domain-containing sensor protein